MFLFIPYAIIINSLKYLLIVDELLKNCSDILKFL